MRKLVPALFLLAASGFAAPSLQAGHRAPVRVCEITHPAYYYQSFGQRRHGRYAVGHFQSYHRSSRYYESDRGFQRRGHYRPRHYDRDFRFQARRGYRHHYRHHYRDHYRHHYRHRRPRLSLHFEF